jgi:MtrB/PioB family decaheme-associated outer membrane protein
MMRTASVLLVATLALVPSPAGAQTPDTTGAAGTTGRIDFGVRGTSLTGDAARYERYRDLGDGLFLENIRLAQAGPTWWSDFTAEHVGRTDQRFRVNFTRPGQVRIWAMYDQIPMLFSRTTRTLYDDDGFPAGLLIDDAIQEQVAADRDVLPGLFDANARTFDLNTRRYTGVGGFEYLPTQAWTLRGTVQLTRRNGAIPYGGSFGHSQIAELPAPVEHRTTDVEGSAEYARDPVLVRAGVNASLFHNEVTELAFDNPLVASDRVGASSVGRLSLAPSNSFVNVNGLVSVKMPYRSRLTAYAALGQLSDGGNWIMPQTINSALSPQPLERAFVQGEARTSAANLSFITRPGRHVSVDLRYRLYDYDNQTPILHLGQRVAYDNTVNTTESHTEPQSVRRQNFTADLNLTPLSRASFGVGFTSQLEDRTFRIFDSTTEYGTRAWFDAIGHRFVNVRTKYEYSRRRTDTSDASAEEFLAEFGEQPGMRHFDIAERDRHRVTVLASVLPTDSLSLNVSLAAGKDDYIDSEFGLRDNRHRVVTAGFDVAPAERMSYGVSYSYEWYNALSRSRQANPGAQFDDPSRNWATDGTDRVHSFIATFGAEQIADRFDLEFSYDFNRARATYEYITGAVPDRTLPEEVIIDTTLPTPTELPPTLSQLHRATADLVYAVNGRVSIGLSYWYEDYRVEDFTLDADANVDLVRGSVVLLGYLYRPYTANTVWGRIIYRF